MATKKSAGATSKKAVTKKATSKKATTKKATSKKATTKKATAKKATSKKATSKKATAKKATTKKAATKKATTKKATTKKATTKKAATKKATAKKATSKKAATKKTATKKTATKKTASEPLVVALPAIERRPASAAKPAVVEATPASTTAVEAPTSMAVAAVSAPSRDAPRAPATPTASREAPPAELSTTKTPPRHPLAQAAAALCLAKKATDPVILDVERLTSYADFFVVASAPSDRQVAAVASSVEEELKKLGFRTMGVEGKTPGNWVLLDYGDFVIHVFLDEARAYYDIEGFWADAPRVPVDEQLGLSVLAELEAEREQQSA